MISFSYISLTHWGRETHICVGNLTIIGSDNGLSPQRRQAIIWTNAGILLIGPLGKNFSEIIIEIQTFSLKKIRLKMASAKCCSFRIGLNVLTATKGHYAAIIDDICFRHTIVYRCGLLTPHGFKDLEQPKWDDACCLMAPSHYYIRYLLIID